MQPRLDLATLLDPDAMQAVQSLGKYIADAGEGLPLELAMMRASQINGCSACVQLHGRAQEGRRD